MTSQWTVYVCKYSWNNPQKITRLGEETGFVLASAMPGVALEFESDYNCAAETRAIQSGVEEYGRITNMKTPSTTNVVVKVTRVKETCRRRTADQPAFRIVDGENQEHPVDTRTVLKQTTNVLVGQVVQLERENKDLVRQVEQCKVELQESEDASLKCMQQIERCRQRRVYDEEAIQECENKYNKLCRIWDGER
jgi:hypothetical protein